MVIFAPCISVFAGKTNTTNVIGNTHQKLITSMKRRQYHSISNIVATVYCERQAVLDRERGELRTIDVRVKAAAGTFEHKRFELEGKALAAVDRRCFIATAIYGGDAAQTNQFRAWRDRVLMQSCIGRTWVRIYYVVSPRLLPLLSRSPSVAALVRRVLDVILRRIGGGK